MIADRRSGVKHPICGEPDMPKTVMLLAAVLAFTGAVPAAAAPPNVVLILTDDQGFGDLGCHGNPVLKTPHVDRLARQGVELTHCYVCPVCSPTRAGLLTGRYHLRTGVVDTFLGRAMMHADEETLAEVLAAAGYRTGIFGKWHLGDNYPLRPQDQGFQECLVLRGGGLTQPADPPGGSHYHDPILFHNGKQEQVKGYCSDVFTDAAIHFIEQSHGRPFFAYLPFNCPHAPLEAPEAETAPYQKLDLSPAAFPAVGQPLRRPLSAALLAKLYGMVTNIDTNVGRLLAKLDELKLSDDTIVIFLTDNGPQEGRYNAGLRGLKGTVYEGGIRVPCFWRWPNGRLPAGKTVDAATANIDFVPTLRAACGVTAAPAKPLDGVNLLPLLRGEVTELPERTLFFQWHRGDAPERYRACAARGPRWKLVQAGVPSDPPKFELFDLIADPFEQHDRAAEQVSVVAQLKQAYERWFDDVGKPRGYAPPRIVLGAPQENPSQLTRQDWRGPKAGWTADSVGHWEVTTARAGKYDVTVRFAARPQAGTVRFTLGGASAARDAAAGATTVTFSGMELPAGDGRLEALIEAGGKTAGATYVDVKRVD
jgi:arylsulfatase A-like enzyme